MAHYYNDSQSLASPTFSQLSLAQASEATSSSHVSASALSALSAPSPSDSLGPMTPANALGQLGLIKAASAADAAPAPPAPSSSSSSDAPASAAPTVVGVPPSSLAARSDDGPSTDVEMDDLDRLPPLDPAALMQMPSMPFPPSPARGPLDIPCALGRTGLSPRVNPAGLIGPPHHLLRAPAVNSVLSPATAASAPAQLDSAATLPTSSGPGTSAVPPSPLLTSVETVAATPALSEPDLIPTQDGREEVIPSDGPLVGPSVETLRALASGSDARSAAVRAKYGRQKRESIAQGRKPGTFLTLSSEEKTALFASIGKAKKRTVSDANKLPLSTGRRGIPRPIPTLDELQSIQDDFRRRDHWRSFGSINDEVESDSGDRRPSLRPAKGKMLRSIPCLFVADIGLALPFYREILGFVNVAKPEKHMAMLCRTPTGKSILRGGEEGVQILLRTSFGSYGVIPTGASGSDVPRPVPTALWIEVENVDELFDEIYAKCRKTDPVEHSYFPMLPFGQARILDRPQNTPFGTREVRVHDPDTNILIFFQELRPEPPLPTDTKVRGPVFRPRGRGRGRR